MSTLSQMSASLVGVGGTAPYVFSVVPGANTTIPATISGSLLTVDATTLEPGLYTVQLLITDQDANMSTEILTVEVLDQNQFSVLNRDLSYEPSVFPSATTVTLNSVGATGAVTWSLLPSVTTLPGAALSGSTLSFSLTAFGQWSIGVRATDAVGKTASQVFNVSVAAAAVVSVVDGHALLKVSATGAQVGAHQFTLSVLDADSTLKSSTFNYTVDEPLSEVDVPESAIDHFWGAGDSTSVVYPIAGDLSGFTVGATTPVTAANGLTVTIDPTTDSVIISGPPTAFGNAEVYVPIAILQGTSQVATITRQFTLVSHSGTTGLGEMTCTTKPYLVGELIGLNPERPYFNSPSIFKNTGYTVSLATGSSLPLGLSLDSVTGLIYGTVLAADVSSSTLHYVDSTGTVQGTIAINWTLLPGQFQLTDSLGEGQLQASYTGAITTSSAALLSSVSIYRGQLPTGLTFSLSTDKTRVLLSGTPTVAGYFDLWLQVTNANQQVAYLYKRLVVDYIAPLTILTDALQRMVTGQSFTQTLSAVGGTQPYAWSLIAGTLPAGIALNAASGVLSGTPTASSYSQTLTFQVADKRGVTATVALPFAINNALTITTTVLPLIVPGQFYQFQLNAEGGQGSYAWSLANGSAALPGGVTLSAAGVLSGATSLQAFSANLIVQVTDGANNVASQTFALTIGTTSGLTIDTEGIGEVVRGGAYQGVVRVLGNGSAPFSWSVTPDTPNALPAGLTLATSQGNMGATAVLSGTTTATLLNLAVKIQVVDANGNSATAFLLLNSYSALAITTTSLPQATVTGNYSTALACSGLNPSFTWSLDPSSPALPSGMNLSSGGVLSGTPSSASDVVLVFRVTDAIGDYAAASLEFVAKASTLAITTSSLPGATAGVAYSTALGATGGQTAYTWSISPSSASLLPAGLSLTASSGLISGTTVTAGYNQTVTFRVTDAIGVYREVALQLTVRSALSFATGPDSVAGTSLGYLGMVCGGSVAGINPRPNRSFFVVASNVVSPTASGLSFGLPTGYSASVLSLSGGTAILSITGPFASGAVGDNSFAFSMQDSGVNGSATFQWRVYTENAIAIVPLSGTLPLLYS